MITELFTLNLLLFLLSLVLNLLLCLLSLVLKFLLCLLLSFLVLLKLRLFLVLRDGDSQHFDLFGKTC